MDDQNGRSMISLSHEDSRAVVEEMRSVLGK